MEEVETIENKTYYYGDLLEPKKKNIFRGISVQLAGLPVDPTHCKHEEFIQAVVDHDADVVAIQEVGLNFNQLGVNGQWKKRIGWNTWLNGHRCKTINAWNSKDHVKQVQQHGGVAILARGDTCFYAAGAGTDPSKMGRWCWTRYRGKNEHYLRVVSFYRPCDSKGGERTVSAVQRRCLQDDDDVRDPRKAFLEDFQLEIESWTDAGDALVICGDINDDILGGTVEEFFEDLGLRHLIFSKHDSAQAPPTCTKVTTSTRAVDGIWASPCLDLVRGGYLPKRSFPGDHLSIWFELSYEQAFGHALPKIWRPTARRLQLRDPRCVTRYNRLLKKFLYKNNLPLRQSALEAAVAYQASWSHEYYLTKEQQEEAWEIDILTAECQLLAEEKCRKLRMGGVLFSPAIMILRYQVAFWRIALARRKGEQVPTRQWSRMKKKAEVRLATRDMSVEDMTAALTEAYSAYKVARKSQESNRLKFIETFEPKHRDRILRNEEARRKGRVSKMVSGKSQGQGVVSIQRSDYVNGEEVLTECSTPAQVTETLMEVNSAKYQMCNQSPFMKEPLLSDFGYFGDTAAGQAVLNGTYVPPPGTDFYSTLLLQHMERPPNVPAPAQCPLFVSTEDHIASWKRTKEYTSSGISGLHFGMFKAQCKDADLAAFDASRRSIMYSTGSYYPRWNTGVDVMLLKASLDTRAHKLRTILLLEADFNMNCKKLGREGMWFAEEHGCVAREQGGGRRDHRAEDSSLNLVLINDDARFKRKAMIICSNDAKGCYDRIVHSIAFICLQRFGVPRPPLLSMFQVIQNLTHHIRTAFGDSECTYGPHTGEHPNQGILQGNGAAGATWAAVSTPIFNAMRSMGFGYSSWSAISKGVVDLVCSAFIDDNDLVHSGPTNDTPASVVLEGMQSALDTWDGLLRVTGGALEMQKSYWYLIDFERRKGKWCYKPTSANPGELLLFNDDTGTKDPVPRKTPHQAGQALGILSRPDGAMHDEVKHLRAKGQVWADGLRSRRIRKDDAWYCVNSSILRAIQYPLTATSLTRDQCSKVMAPILKALLASVRVQSNLSRTLVYAPAKFQCLAIDDTWAIQLIKHLHCILRHCSRDTVTGSKILSNMENLTLELGSGTSFWDLDYTLWECLATPSWITYTWRELDKTELSLRGPMELLKPQRVDDVFLMDAFVALDLDPADLISLNDVRMYKQVTRLSDIVSADGTQSSWIHFLQAPDPPNPLPTTGQDATARLLISSPCGRPSCISASWTPMQLTVACSHL